MGSARPRPDLQRSRKPELFGPMLARHRLARDMTTRELGTEVRIDARDISRFELRERLPPPDEQIARLCKVLRLGEEERVELLAAAAYDRGALDVDGLDLDALEGLVRVVAWLRGGKRAAVADLVMRMVEVMEDEPR